MSPRNKRARELSQPGPQRQAAEANGGAAAEDADGAEYSDGEEDDGEVSDGDYAQGQEFDDDEGYPGDGDESGDDEPVL